MNHTWKQFERLVAAIHQAETQGAQVTWDDKINGRQFDVTIRFKLGIHEYLTVIECKDYLGKVSVEKVEALVTKSHGVNANKTIMVSSNGYQSGCFDVATRYGISLLTLNQKIEIDIDDLVDSIIPALNIFSVKLILKDSTEYLLEEEGGKLAYLMNNIEISASNWRSTPNVIITQWQLNTPELNSYDEKEATVAVPIGSTAKIPFENDLAVTGIKFKYKLTDAFKTNKPTLDMATLESLGTKYELIDETGKVINTTSISDLSVGFDTELKPGRFYFSPSVGYYYYCDKVIGDLVYFVLVESYQHGSLIQAKYTQKLEWSKKYVEVTDKGKLALLQKLLRPLMEKS
jgi:hypothetical protein